MRSAATGLLTVAVLASAPAQASALHGPARFCGYSPIIDLLPGERVTTRGGGIHGGSFRWEGAFGALEVHGIGAASRPKGRIVKALSADRPARFAERRTERGHEIAIWNGAHAAAYVLSPRSFTQKQISAIERVTLFEEGENPSGCKLRTVFSWE